MTAVEKEFTISHVFKDISSMKDGEYQYSSTEEHFGVPWKTGVKRNADHLGLFLYSEPKNQKNEWSIKTWYETKLRAVNGKSISKNGEDIFQNTGWGWPKFISWNDAMKGYVDDDSLTVEYRVEIKKMTGIPKGNLMDFDETIKEFSDVVLIVENQKFYVSKLFLARNSSYFKTLLLGNFDESGKPEITLSGISAADFQNFLELLHGESPIDDSTIEGILHLADMYDAKLPIQKCQRFLIKESEKSLKEKLQLAHRYNLKNLRDHCLPKITTVADIRSVLAENLGEMDISVVEALMQKLLALNEKYENSN